MSSTFEPSRSALEPHAFELEASVDETLPRPPATQVEIALQEKESLGRGRLLPLRAGLILIGLSAAIALGRLHTFDEPVERDLATYAVVANELLQGRKLYTEIWDNRTPAIHLTYAAAQLLVGHGQAQFYLLGVAAAAVTLLGVYWAASHGGRRPDLGLWAAAFWTAVQGNLAVQANQPNTEVFMNACMVWAFALLVARPNATRGLGWALAIGALLALGTLYKHILIVHAAFFALAHFAFPPRTRRDKQPACPDPVGRANGGQAGSLSLGPRSRALREVLVMAAVGAAAWGGLFAYFTLTGRLQDFYEAVFVFNRHDIASTLGAGFLDTYTYQGTLIVCGLALPLSVLVAVGGILGLRRRWTRPGVMLLAYTAATLVAIALPHRSYPHYYMLWLPVLAVGGTWTLDLLLNPVQFPRRFPATAGTVLFLLLCFRVPEYWLTPEDCSRKKYDFDLFIDARRAARDLDELLLPEERFFQWGFEPELYLYAGRPPPTSLPLSWPALFGPLRTRLAEQMLTELKRDPPELVVVVLEDAPAPEWHPVVKWFTAHYTPFGNRELQYPFRFCYRKGGKLEERIQYREQGTGN